MLLSRRDIHRARHHFRRHFRRDADGGKGSAGGSFVKALEVGVPALGFGVIKGRYGAVYVPGTNQMLPLDAALAVLLHGAAFMGWMGKATNDVHNVADGVLASYLTTLGAGLGKAWATKAGVTVSGRPHQQHIDPRSHRNRHRMAGNLPPGQAPLSEVEMRAMTNAVR